MKRLLLYFIALTCAVCILSGCRKEERKEDRKPVIEGVYWCPERMKDSELPEPLRSQTSHLGMKKLTPMYSVNLPQTVY